LNNPSKPGTFSERVTNTFRHFSNHTMGVDFGDINNDGLNDIMALDMLAEPAMRRQELMNTMTLDRQTTLIKYGYGKQQMRNVLQLNNGNGTFSEIGCLAGVFQTDWSWAPLIQDYDNDGWRDIFVANGYRRDMSNLDYINFVVDSVSKMGGFNQKNIPDVEKFLDLIPSTPIQNYCYRNRGDLTFENASTAWGFTDLNYSNGSAYADLDNDGDLDMIVNALNSEALIYKNRAAEQNKGAWLQIRLQGAAPNTFAVGARVHVKVGNNEYVDELTPTRGFFSSVEPLLHYGLDKARQADLVEVEFPGGKLVRLQNVPANQRLVVKIDDARPGKISLPAAGAAIFRTGNAPAFTHREDDIQDFTRERLLPWKMSCPGPKIAVGDVNGDGQDDCFIGNAAGAPGAVFIQRGGAFQSASGTVLDSDKESEDTGAVFFDSDGDKDMDLAVASGGNTDPANAASYAPRIYINDGKGNFTKKSSGMPVSFGSLSVVTAFDYDGDGDEDLFWGGWGVPGKYPASVPGMVWQNDKGNFTDMTDRAAPGFKGLGMVRDMTWADFNGDGKKELLIAGEWTGIRLFAVNNGKVEDISASYGLSGTEGIWRSLEPADLDGDGDMDFVAGNIGLNTRFTASQEAPLRMYAKDFDGNGSMDPVMTQMEGSHEYPVALREVLIKQLPGLRKKFVRTINYAKAGIGDVLDEEQIKSATQFRCNYLASTVFINEGGKFVMKKLPNEAQISPVMGIQCFDWQNDGDMDILIVGNDYGQQTESGPLDAGNGLLLENTGKGAFRAIAPRRSGFWASGEARDVKMLKSGNTPLFLVANNNGATQAYYLIK
ncbi:MAG: VCBS repeat-containing protein, partial [Saprospiraceae bacterium]|nr:VCBS repeat-containing protein [Saprospiraceae bacterium]